MTLDEPLFMKDHDWYVTPADEGLESCMFDDGRGYHLRDDVPDEVHKSYEEFYAALEGQQFALHL
ncbi:hypothetical protein [Olsenella urininfantis]|uniref:hypothetical protein n=1 Tax=Olsenella urininfantis TaxID=1871033 RepID=UPI000985A5CF|nr:hypothetical protein [Olsenella urininfantis]